MSGYELLMAACFGCGRLFASNPAHVPSYENQPICRNCITLVNTKRREQGLPEWPIHPDAYEPEETL